MKGLIDLLQRQSSGKVTRNRIKVRVKTGTKPETEEKLILFQLFQSQKERQKVTYIIIMSIPLSIINIF